MTGDSSVSGWYADAQPNQLCVVRYGRTTMTVKVISEREVLREAAEVLLQHMEPAKVARFWAIW